MRLVQARLQELRPRAVRPAQRTGYRPGQVLQLDWAEMPTRPTLAGRERRLYALVASLPYSGAQTAFFSVDLTLESFLEGHVRTLEWLGGVPRECVYDNLRSVVARREGDEVVWNRRFLHLRGHYGFHAHPLTPARFDWSGYRSVRVPVDGYLRHGGCFYRAPERLVHERVELRFDRDQVWICHRGQEVGRYQRSYEQGLWLPPPIMRPEPPAAATPVVLPRVAVAPPELAAYAELCT